MAQPAIWWIRRDLRLADNQALAAALEHPGGVIPVFVLDSRLIESSHVGDKRLAFLFAGLRALDADLQARGSRLIVRRGRPEDVLAALREETGASRIYAEADYTPFARRRDNLVEQDLPLHLVEGVTVHPPDIIIKEDGTPYRVYTPFSRQWKALPLPRQADIIPAPERVHTPAGLVSEPLPDAPALPSGVPFTPGEAEALHRLNAFVGSAQAPISRYTSDRNRMDLPGTSTLSPYLRFGMLSARQAVVTGLAARESAPGRDAQKGVDTWINELIWREFYISILYHYPYVMKRSFREAFQAIEWANDREDYVAWCEGRTGYPVVDAAMRQLASTGWMHNRARMIVASFLVKDLLIDWRRGEQWFMQHLVDGDPAANNGGWQWTAGTGTDAAPYFRIFNPVLQGQKFDPQGDFIRAWVPELVNVPTKHIHMPWKMPPDVQQAAGCVIGQDYPAPIVDHKWARERTLAAFARAKELS